MNALLLPYVADTHLRVVGRTWITLDQPELHLALEDGSSVLIQWDVSYGCRNLFVAAAGEDFISCTSAQTGMDPDELEGLVDEVYRAVEQDEAERLADSWDDGREG